MNAPTLPPRPAVVKRFRPPKRLCLVDGKHTNPIYARECPLRTAGARSERSRRAARARARALGRPVA